MQERIRRGFEAIKRALIGTDRLLKKIDLSPLRVDRYEMTNLVGLTDLLSIASEMQNGEVLCLNGGFYIKKHTSLDPGESGLYLVGLGAITHIVVIDKDKGMETDIMREGGRRDATYHIVQKKPDEKVLTSKIDMGREVPIPLNGEVKVIGAEIPEKKLGEYSVQDPLFSIMRLIIVRGQVLTTVE